MRRFQRRLKLRKPLLSRRCRRFHTALQPVVQSVQCLFGGKDALAGSVAELVGQQGQLLPEFLHAPHHGALDAAVQFVQQLHDSVPFRNQTFDGV